MEICLIAPAPKRDQERRQNRPLPLFPPLSLMTVAALTPEEHTVRIIDEALGAVDFDLSPDLVGLTATTAVAPRAYEIADGFRAKGVPVVMGGMHASALPSEALQHVDAVVVGEAEGLWPQVLEDAAHGRLQPIYRHQTLPDPRLIPAARRDLLDVRRYCAGNTLQASRGCPFACTFCTVSTFFGRSYRTRPVDEVIQEAASLDGGPLLFVDDNIVGDPSYAKELFARLAHLGKPFVSQASTTILRYPDLIAQAGKSGCRALFIGLESICQERLARLSKGFNIAARYTELVQRLHEHGIATIGSFMFGLDGDDPDVFDRTVEFAQQAGIDFAQFAIVTPLPGTRLYANLQRQGRIFEPDWGKYDGGHCVFTPVGMSPDQLEAGLRRAYRQFYLSVNLFGKLARAGDLIRSVMYREYFSRVRQWISSLGEL